MDKKIEGKILDIAAELLVSPLAAYAKAVEIKETVTGSETYEKTKDAAKSAGRDIKNAAVKAYESDAVQKGIGAVKDTAKKVSESDIYQKAKDGAEKGIETAKSTVKGAMTRLGFGEGEEAEGEETCEETPEESEEEPEEEAAAALEEEGIEGAIEEVDLSGIITEDDANEEVPEE